MPSILKKKVFQNLLLRKLSKTLRSYGGKVLQPLLNKEIEEAITEEESIPELTNRVEEDLEKLGLIETNQGFFKLSPIFPIILNRP